MENVIILSKGATSWNSDHQGPFAAEIKKLFGTTILPTAFTTQAAPETVKAEIEKLNPGVKVIFSTELR